MSVSMLDEFIVGSEALFDKAFGTSFATEKTAQILAEESKLSTEETASLAATLKAQEDQLFDSAMRKTQTQIAGLKESIASKVTGGMEEVLSAVRWVAIGLMVLLGIYLFWKGRK